jgi:hypothetical protein
MVLELFQSNIIKISIFIFLRIELYKAWLALSQERLVWTHGNFELLEAGKC